MIGHTRKRSSLPALMVPDFSEPARSTRLILLTFSVRIVSLPSTRERVWVNVIWNTAWERLEASFMDVDLTVRRRLPSSIMAWMSSKLAAASDVRSSTYGPVMACSRMRSCRLGATLSRSCSRSL